MTTLRSASLTLMLTALFLAAAPARAASATQLPSQPLTTGVTDPSLFLSPSASTAFKRVRAAGATTAGLELYWGSVAPGGAQPPPGFKATDPNDRHYNWAPIDREVKLAVAAGLDPILNVSSAPRWAQPQASDVPYKPDPTAFGEFARAAALRYSGKFRSLPRVRYWEAWNEPNITTFLQPQWLNGKPFSPDWYRAMVNAFALGIHGAAAGNVVIAGAVAPFADQGVTDVTDDWGPLAFMRDLLCLSPSLTPTCRDRVSFDVWSMHPYTSGGPSHHAYLANDVSLGDLPEMRRTLLAGIRAGHVRAPHGVKMWATEFSWDSAPPDPQAVPMRTLQQWIPKAFYRLWQNGVTHVSWFRVRDDPMSQSPFQSGLYFNGGSVRQDRPKPILANFRFPLVLIPQATGVYVWGRTPWGKRGKVTIETTARRGWQPISTMSADRFGIFHGKLHAGFGVLGAWVRAVGSKNDASGRVPVAPIADHFYNPFGTTPPLEHP